MKLIRIMPMLALLTPVPAFAGAGPGKFALGVGVYLLETYQENVFTDREAQHGGALSVSYLLDDDFVLHGTYYSAGSGDFDGTDIEGSELLLYWGRNLTQPGLRMSIGGGYFSEDWDGSSDSESISGLQLGYGLGYNWENFSINGLIHFRNSSEYDDIFVRPDDIESVFTLSIVVSTRF